MRACLDYMSISTGLVDALTGFACCKISPRGSNFGYVNENSRAVAVCVHAFITQTNT
jgi:hypothetical protein